jgi:hypothetical protein
LQVNIEEGFAVCGWFHITDLWAEARIDDNEKRVTHWQYSLEKINLDEPSWWMPEGLEKPDIKPLDFVPSKESCASCRQKSKTIYAEGWTCLTHNCEDFFKFPEGIRINDVHYSEVFINERTPFNGENPGSYIPPLPEKKGTAYGTEKEFRRGIVCPKCGTCSRRRHWDRWVCEKLGCSFEHRVQMEPYPLDKVHNEEAIVRAKPTMMQSGFKCPQVKVKLGGHEVTMSVLFEPGTEDKKIAGIVTLFRSTNDINSGNMGPDHLFDSLQHESIDLKRNVVRHPASEDSFSRKSLPVVNIL